MQTKRDHVPSAAPASKHQSSRLGKGLDTPYTIHAARQDRVVHPGNGSGFCTLYVDNVQRGTTAKSLLLRFLGQNRGGRGSVGFTAILLAVSAVAGAQGILTVTPTRTAATTAGTGSVGYSGNGSTAVVATLANPSAVAYDAAGDIFLADANNHVVREVMSGGTISTIAGTGVAGFAGDGGAATAAKLALPSAVAVDASGNIYIADTNNHRIRKISGGTISTIAGDGEELFAGDGGAATAAALDSPTGVAVDANGNVYIADRLNQRIREVSAGNISTIAGSGTVSFAGAFGGDGANATAASLARPSGVSVDASGNVYIADTENQRIREVSSTGTISTVIGSGAQGYSGDGGAATAAILNSPKAATPDALGNLSVADRQNQRIRAGLLPSLALGSSPVGVGGTAQSVTLANTGSASITVATITFAGAFATTTGGSCGAAPITLGPGASCTQNLEVLPTGVGPITGSVVFGGAGVVPQKVLLAGSGVPATTTTTLISSLATPLTGQAVTFTATVQPIGLGTATGSVTFYSGAVALGTVSLSSGSAQLTTAALPDGTSSISAVYSSDPNFTASSSNVLPQLVEDFQLVVSGVTLLSVVPGTSATFGGTLTSPTGAFTYPVVLSITGLPAGAVATFNPASVTLGPNPVGVTVTIQTPMTARLHYPGLVGGGSVALALLVLPFSRRMRRRIPQARLWLSLLMLLGLGSLTGLSGCGSSSGLFGQQPRTYTLSLVGTATGANGFILQRSISYTLTVQ